MRKAFLNGIFGGGCAGLAPLVIPAVAEERALTLSDCVDLAIRHNLEFESAMKNPLIAAQDLRIAPLRAFLSNTG